MLVVFLVLLLMACGTIWKRSLKKYKEVFDEKEKENLSWEEQQTEGLGDDSKQGRWDEKGRVGLSVVSVQCES